MASKKSQQQRKPLFRKINSKALRSNHGRGGEARWNRNTKGGHDNPAVFLKMKSNHQHGLDYNPLFKFLLRKVGGKWSEIHSEAISRLDREEPIFWLVAKTEVEAKDIIRVGESSYYGGLFVDSSGILQRLDPISSASDFLPGCPCCTHSYNGVVLTHKFDPSVSPTGGIKRRGCPR